MAALFCLTKRLAPLMRTENTMNLRELRNAIQNLANLKPTNADHLLDIDNLINAAYLHVWHSKPWSFNQKVVNFAVLPDMTYETEAVSAEVNDFRRSVGFTGPIRALTNIWEGHWIELNGRDYEILKVVSTSEIQLKEPYRGATDDITTWRFKMRNYALPSDLVSIVGLSHRDHPSTGTTRRHIPAMMPGTDEHLALSSDRSSTYADYYIPMPSIVIPPGEKLAETTPEEPTPCTLPANYYYEFAWAFRHNEWVGALSEPLVVKVATEESAAQAIGLSPYTHDDTLVVTPAYNDDYDKQPNVWEGYRKILYVNVNYNHVTGERLGLPKWVVVTQYSGSISQYDHNPYLLEDEESEWIIRYKEQVSPGNPAYIEVDGQYQVLRPFPRINGYDYHYDYGTIAIIGGTIYKPDVYWKQLELRYVYKPAPLARLTDTPEMPYETHQLIVSKALEDYYLKMGNASMSQVHRANYEKEAAKMAIKYTERGPSNHQRLPQYGIGGRIYGPQTIKWNG